MEEVNRRGIKEGFTRETVDPILHSENGIRGDVVQRAAFGEEAADERILLLIKAALIGCVRMSVVNGNIGTQLWEAGELAALVTGNRAEHTAESPASQPARSGLES